MHILFVSEKSKDNYGGIETHIRTLANEYLKVGFDESNIKVSFLDSSMFEGFTIFNKKIVYKSHIKKKLLNMNPDVVHIHGFSSIFIFQVVSLLTRSVTKIYSPHYHPFSKHKRPLLARLFFYLYSLSYIRIMDKIIP